MTVNMFSRLGILLLLVFSSISRADVAATQPAKVKEPLDVKLVTVLDAVQFDSVPLDKALAKLAEQGRVNLVVDWEDLEAVHVWPDQSIDLRLRGVSLRTALSILLEVAGPDVKLGFRESVSENLIRVATEKKLDDRSILKMYDVRDLIERNRKYLAQTSATHPADEALTPAELSDRLSDLIEKSVDPGSWFDEGGRYRITDFAGRFFIDCTEEMHRKVAKILQSLREADDTPRPTTRPVTIGR
jgi:hypothetical protein